MPIYLQGPLLASPQRLLIRGSRGDRDLISVRLWCGRDKVVVDVLAVIVLVIEDAALHLGLATRLLLLAPVLAHVLDLGGVVELRIVELAGAT